MQFVKCEMACQEHVGGGSGCCEYNKLQKTCLFTKSHSAVSVPDTSEEKIANFASLCNSKLVQEDNGKVLVGKEKEEPNLKAKQNAQWSWSLLLLIAVLTLIVLLVILYYVLKKLGYEIFYEDHMMNPDAKSGTEEDIT